MFQFVLSVSTLLVTSCSHSLSPILADDGINERHCRFVRLSVVQLYLPALICLTYNSTIERIVLHGSEPPMQAKDGDYFAKPPNEKIKAHAR